MKTVANFRCLSNKKNLIFKELSILKRAYCVTNSPKIQIKFDSLPENMWKTV